MMLATFHPDAQAELNRAIAYYEAIHSSLDYQFAIVGFRSGRANHGLSNSMAIDG